MISDAELLRQYARDGQEPAFTEVVLRYTDLVYSAALRMVAGDAHLAQDVAQRVFGALARQAGALAGRSSIVGWLYTTTHHTASVVVRTERRRRAREQIAFAMQIEPTRAETDWSQLQPVLDEEICRLAQADREAVLLRFFQGKSHREVGQALGVSEDLARKRVERVLEKLRAAFSRRGLRLTSAALAEAVTAHSVHAAPAGLSAELAKCSFAQAGAGSLANPAAPILLLAMKTKITAVLAVLLLGLCFFGAWHYYHAKGLALSAGTVTATNPSGSIAKSGTSADKTNPPAQVVLPVAAATPASASGTVNVTSPSLDAAIANFLKLSAAGDYYSLIQNYMYIPAKGNKNAPETGPEVDEAAQIAANDPQIRAALDLFAKLLAQVKDTTPVFSPDGRIARLPLADGSANVVLRQIDTGAWYISGTEMIQPSDSPSAPTPGPKNTEAAPAPNSPKHNAGPGGYVP